MFGIYIPSMIQTAAGVKAGVMDTAFSRVVVAQNMIPRECYKEYFFLFGIYIHPRRFKRMIFFFYL